MLGIISGWNRKKVVTGFMATEFHGRKECLWKNVKIGIFLRNNHLVNYVFLTF